MEKAIKGCEKKGRKKNTMSSGGVKVKCPCYQNYFHENSLNEHLFIVHKGKDLKEKIKVSVFNKTKKRIFETIKNIIKDLEEHRKKHYYQRIKI